MDQAGTRGRTSASTSLGRASSFLVHQPHRQASAGYTSRGPSHTHLLNPSLPASASWSPSPAMNAAGPSPRLREDVSRLPLDLMETAATRWASTAGRASRAAPRVRSTLGPQSDVVDTGVFVCPDTVVAALYTTAGGREDLVVTAECAGWLRVREQRTGAIRHQQQLRDGNETACLAWAAPFDRRDTAAARTASTRAAAALRTVAVVGQLSGLISFYALVGESLVELSAATCVLHEAPILACVPLRTPAATTAPGTTETAEGQSGPRGLLTVDAEGVVALWSLSVAERARGGAVGLTVELLHCSYAATPAAPPSHQGTAAGAAERDESGRGASSSEASDPSGPSAPPVVISAASLLDASSPLSCAVLTTHRFVAHPPMSDDYGEGEEEEWGDVDAADGGETCALVYLAAFTPGGDTITRPELEGTTLAMSSYLSDTVVSASSDGAAAAAAAAPPQPRHTSHAPRYRWEVLCAYAIPEGLRSRPENRALSIVSLCTVGGGGPAGQLWAGTTDGRLFIWQAQTGNFVRYLRSASPSPVHSLTCVAADALHSSSGDTLVWASQADGSVVAWSAVTYAVVEVLPVSYPPPSATDEGGAADGVVTVRDGVDLLRATRHQHAAPANATRHNAAPWVGKKCGFTLFVQPMEVVCMQRAWSVATDGTVRTWLLPAGEAPASPQPEDDEDDEGVEEEEMGEGRDRRRGGGGGAMLDQHTVTCFLQHKAEAYVREQQAQRLAWDAQEAQLAALRERNEVLASALQQAIGRLERVGADGLVRSASPPEGPPSPSPEAQDRDEVASTAGEGEDVEKDAAPSNASTLSSPSTISQPPGQLVLTAAQLDAAPPPPPPLAPNASTQVHVQVLQQLLEELHSKLEESWSRNDALREELLIYQLRTLEREEDVARRVRETALRESASTARRDTRAHHRGGHRSTSSKSSSSSSSSSAGPPSSPSATRRSELRQRVVGAVHVGSEAQRTASAPEGGSRLASPSRAVEAPTVASLVGRPPSSATSVSSTEGAAARPLSAPTESFTPAASVGRYRAAWEGDFRGDSPSDTPASSAVADRFLSAAPAALQRREGPGRWDGHGGGGSAGDGAAAAQRMSRQEQTPPPRHIQAPTPPSEDTDAIYDDVDVDEYTDDAGDEDTFHQHEENQPALVAAWSTSEADLSPISASTTTAAAAARQGASGDGVHDSLRRPTHSSSLFSYPYLPNSSSLNSTSYDRSSTSGSRNTASAVNPARLYADTWTTPVKAATGGVHERPLPSAFPRPRLAPALPAEAASPGPLPIARVTPVRHAPQPAPAAASPRGFRSPIIFQH